MPKNGEKTNKQEQWHALLVAVASFGSQGAAVHDIEVQLDNVIPRRTYSTGSSGP